MSHVVLLGDSILDNENYVPRGKSVIDQLKLRLPDPWQVTLLAEDGAFASNIHSQLERIPKEVTHCVISAGGNNALIERGILREPASSSQEVFEKLAKIRIQFRKEYQNVIRSVLSLKISTVVCTIYDSIPNLDQNLIPALSIFNDVILQTAFFCGIPVIDLRLICTDSGDYSEISPIEPSESGASKISGMIHHVLSAHDFRTLNCIVYGNPSLRVNN